MSTMGGKKVKMSTKGVLNRQSDTYRSMMQALFLIYCMHVKFQIPNQQTLVHKSLLRVHNRITIIITDTMCKIRHNREGYTKIRNRLLLSSIICRYRSKLEISMYDQGQGYTCLNSLLSVPN